MTRKPSVAGQFYPSDKEELQAAIEQIFVSRFGPGDEPGKRGSKKIAGVIAPHAGYMYSGAGAAWCFKEIGEAAFPDTYILLGVNHSGRDTCVSDEDWETPLGVVKCDKELVAEFKKAGMPVDNAQHRREHSIEVQLPFLQTVSTERKADLKIVCIMIADDDHERWAKIISSAVDSLGRSVVYICSSDFTHYGYNYGYLPFKTDIRENMKKLDMGAIEHIKKLDAEGFLSYVDEKEATICGRCGIAVFLELMKGKKAELLKYYTSGDVVGEYDSAVGYAAIVFR